MSINQTSFNPGIPPWGNSPWTWRRLATLLLSWRLTLFALTVIAAFVLRQPIALFALIPISLLADVLIGRALRSRATRSDNPPSRWRRIGHALLRWRLSLCILVLITAVVFKETITPLVLVPFSFLLEFLIMRAGRPKERRQRSIAIRDTRRQAPSPNRGMPAEANPPSRWHRLGKFIARWPFFTAGTVAGVVMLPLFPWLLPLLAPSGALLDKVVEWRYDIQDVRQQVRALSDRRLIRWYWICTFSCRYYTTGVFAVAALLGAQNWQTAVALIASGLIIDAWRARLSPDLVLSIEEIERRLNLASAGQVDNPLSKWRVHEPWALPLLFFAYMIALFAVVEPSNPTELRDYFALLSPLHDTTALFLRSSRTVVNQLEVMGFAGNAGLAAHVFTVCWLFLVVYVIRITAIILPWQQLAKARAKLKATDDETKAWQETRRHDWTFAMAFIPLIFGLAFYELSFNLMSIDFFIKGDTSFQVHKSNGAYVMVVGWALMSTMFSAMLYGQLIRMRLRLWCGWQERQNAVATPTPTAIPSPPA